MITYLLIIIGAFIGGFAQSVAGFGSAVFMMLIMPIAMNMIQAVAITQVVCLSACTFLFIRWWRHCNWKKVLIPVAIYFPVFFLVIYLTKDFDTDFFKPWMGLFFVLLAIYSLFVEGKFAIKANWLGTLILSIAAGALSALFTIAGPPIVLYFLAATSTKEEYLGSSQAYFLLINFYSIGVRIYAHQMNLGMIPFILVGAVALYIGTYFGGKVVNRIDVKTMKRIAYILVGISGAITFITSL